MKQFEEFSIPIGGLSNEIYKYQFEVGNSFFEAFETSPIKSGRFDVELFLDKRPDMIVCEFGIKGAMVTECDRCLSGINLPMQGQYQLIFKYGEGEITEEVVWIAPDLGSLNVAQYIYEYCCLSIPMAKTYDCENDDPVPCDVEMLEKVKGSSKKEGSNPIWDQLQNIEFESKD